MKIRMFSNAGIASAEMLVQSAGIRLKVRSSLIHRGQLLRTRVMAHASGRPGPNVVTGDYRRSIAVQSGGSIMSPWVAVGTNSPQGRRLEMGYTGVDELGRHYNQPPYPHFGPALDETEPGLIRDLEDLIK